MKILLVTSPHFDHTVYHRHDNWTDFQGRPRLAQCFAPMGLISLASAVGSAAITEIFDINKAINSGLLPMSEHFYDAAAEWLLDSDPDLVGFMTEADSYHHLIRIFQCLKTRRAGVISLLGGVHATAVHYQTLRDFSFVDFIIRGEGEVAFRSFIDELNGAGLLEHAGNLTYRKGSQIVSNAELPLIHDLDSLPMPDFSRITLTPEDAIYLEIGRGCPFKCNFCFTAPYWKRKHRIKSPARIMRELAYLGDRYGRTDFNFTHDLFTRFCPDSCRKVEGVFS